MSQLNEKFGRCWINGYDKSFCIIPGKGIVEMGSRLQASFGQSGLVKIHPPIYRYVTLYVALSDEVNCGLHCSYCIAVPQSKYIKVSNLDKVYELARKLPIDFIVFKGKSEYLKHPDALVCAKRLENYGVGTVLTCNCYYDAIQEFLRQTVFATVGITIELPCNNKDRSKNFDKVLSDVQKLAFDFKGRVSFIPLIPLDGDTNTVLDCIQQIKQIDICSSWSVILPIGGARNNLNIDTKVLVETLGQLDIRVSNFLSQSVIDVLLHGFTCYAIRSLFVSDSRLVICPVKDIVVTDETLDGINTAQASVDCYVEGNHVSCPISAVGVDSVFSKFEWDFLAIAGEQILKEICQTDLEIERLFQNKQVSGEWFPASVTHLKSGRGIGCKASPVLFTES